MARIDRDSTLLAMLSGSHNGWILPWISRMAVPCLLLFAAQATADIHYVSPGGSHSSPFNTGWAGAATNIQAAVDQASAGDFVRIAGGVYTQNVSFGVSDDSIFMRGGFNPSGGAWDPSNYVSVIQSSDGSSCITVSGDSSSNTISTLTLRGATDASAAGIDAGTDADGRKELTIIGCTVTGNYYGVFMPVAATRNVPVSATLQNCLVAENAQDGLYAYCLTPVAHQDATYYYLYNCTIVSNGGHGLNVNGGTRVAPNPTEARNTLFTHNGGYGVRIDGYPSPLYSGINIDDCLLYGNSSGPMWYDTPPTIGSNVLIGQDPNYVDADNGDYRLQTNSPAAASGTDLSGSGVTNDIFGAARPNNGWDMGAYGGSGDGVPLPTNQTYVSTGGSDSNNGSSGSPFATISHALNNTANGGIIRVGGGTYAENLTVEWSATILGGYDTSDWSLDPVSYPTVIDSADGSSCITIGMIAYDCAFSNLTLRGATNANAAGLDCSGVTVNLNELSIGHCISTGNYYGVIMPIVVARGVPLDATLINCLVAQNAQDGLYAGHSGFHQDATKYYLYNCTIVNNTGHGLNVNGGASVAPQPTTARNTIFTDNGGYGIYIDGFVPPYVGLDIDYCLLYGNTSGAMWYDTDATIGSDVLTGQNPKYVDADAADYRLQTNSPAAASGTDLSAVGVTNDILGLARPDAETGLWDMGIYEGSGTGAPPPPTETYVSTAGSDGNNGSSNSPFAAIGYALANTANGGTIRVGAGTYTENIVVDWSTTILGGYDTNDWTITPKAPHGNRQRRRLVLHHH